MLRYSAGDSAAGTHGPALVSCSSSSRPQSPAARGAAIKVPPQRGPDTPMGVLACRSAWWQCGAGGDVSHRTGAGHWSGRRRASARTRARVEAAAAGRGDLGASMTRDARFQTAVQPKLDKWNKHAEPQHPRDPQVPHRHRSWAGRPIRPGCLLGAWSPGNDRPVGLTLLKYGSRKENFYFV